MFSGPQNQDRWFRKGLGRAWEGPWEELGKGPGKVSTPPLGKATMWDVAVFLVIFVGGSQWERNVVSLVHSWALLGCWLEASGGVLGLLCDSRLSQVPTREDLVKTCLPCEALEGCWCIV